MEIDNFVGAALAIAFVINAWAFLSPKPSSRILWAWITWFAGGAVSLVVIASEFDNPRIFGTVFIAWIAVMMAEATARFIGSNTPRWGRFTKFVTGIFVLGTILVELFGDSPSLTCASAMLTVASALSYHVVSQPRTALNTRPNAAIVISGAILIVFAMILGVAPPYSEGAIRVASALSVLYAALFGLVPLVRSSLSSPAKASGSIQAGSQPGSASAPSTIQVAAPETLAGQDPEVPGEHKQEQQP